MPNRVAERRVARAERSRRDLAAPGERRAAWFRSRAHERPAANIATQKTARFKFAVRTDHCGAADSEPLGQLALGGQTRPGWKFAACDGRFEQVDEMAVQRPRGPHELTLDLLKHHSSRTWKCGPTRTIMRCPISD